MKKAIPRKQPLKVEIVKGVLTISIGVETLKWSAEHTETGFLHNTGKYALAVSDADIFAKDVLGALEDEAEDGTTPVHTLLDKAIEQAWDNGSEGLDFDEIEARYQAEKIASAEG